MLFDLLILVVLTLYAVIGYRSGFITQVIELLSFVGAFVAALTLYRPLGGVITGTFDLPSSLANLAAFMVLWLGLEFLFSFAWRRLRPRLPSRLQQALANRIAGIAPGLLKGVVLVMILLLIVAASPLPAAAKQPLTESALGKGLLSFGTGLQQQFNNVFGNALKDTLAFRTIKTEGGDSVPLGFTSGGTVCADDESELRDLVNRERTARGLGAVRQDDQLREVGRAHSRDMLARGYFSHDNPDGQDPFDRMDAAEVDYLVAGENLAFAPTVDIAHSGLMNSPGHKANILKPEFTRLGIGCIDAGFRGKMFSQEFAGP